MHVNAKDKTTGKENKITIKANSGLSEAEIQKMLRDAEAHAQPSRLKVSFDILARRISPANQRFSFMLLILSMKFVQCQGPGALSLHSLHGRFTVAGLKIDGAYGIAQEGDVETFP